MGLRVYLDDILLQDTPIGWDEASVKSKRGITFKGLFLTYSTELSFWGDGFDYIDGVMEVGYCESIKVTIDSDDCMAGVWENEFNGLIQIPQITNSDLVRGVITTKIFDDTFDGKINNNKSIKAFLDVGLSKNGVSITEVTPVEIDFFDPTQDFGTYTYTNRDGWRIDDAFEFIIQYMTDGQVGFYSDLLSGDYLNWMLFNGKELRGAASEDNQIEVSFKELFTEVNKKTNISFAIEPDPTGTYDYRLRLEETAYFEQDNEILTLDNVNDIGLSFNTDDLYSDVNVGSTPFDDDRVLNYPPFSFKTFKKENYTLLGECNIDKSLELVSNWLIDSNVIEDCLINNEDKYDDKTFLIVTDGTNALKYKEYGEPVSYGVNTSTGLNTLSDSGATFITDGVAIGDMAVNMETGFTANVNSVASETALILSADIFPASSVNYQVRTGPYNYNDPLTNLNVIDRFGTGLPASVIKRLSTSSVANFQASLTTAIQKSTFPATLNPILYQDDFTPPNFDDNASYDPSTGEYTVANSGLYGFRATAKMRLNGVEGPNLMVNGDFALTTGWSQWSPPSGTSFNISGGQFVWTGGVGAHPKVMNASWLTQAAPLSGKNCIYQVSFQITAINRTVVEVYDAYNKLVKTATAVGFYIFYIDQRNAGTPNPNITFKMKSLTDNNVCSGALDNVVTRELPSYDITQTFVRRASDGTILQEFSELTPIFFSANDYQRDVEIINEKTFSTFATELITSKMLIEVRSGTGNLSELKVQSSYETIMVDDGGGDLLPINAETYPIYKYKFKKALTFAEFQSLRDNPEKAVLFSPTSQDHIFGWRNSIKWDRKTGETTFELRSKTKLSRQCQTE